MKSFNCCATEVPQNVFSQLSRLRKLPAGHVGEGMGWWSELLDPVLLSWDLDRLSDPRRGAGPHNPCVPFQALNSRGWSLNGCPSVHQEKALPFAGALVLRDSGTFMVL